MGITDPDPLYHPDGLTMFDPRPAIVDYNDPIPPGLARVTGNLLRAVAGNCDAFCEVREAPAGCKRGCMGISPLVKYGAVWWMSTLVAAESNPSPSSLASLPCFSISVNAAITLHPDAI